MFFLCTNHIIYNKNLPQHCNPQRGDVWHENYIMLVFYHCFFHFSSFVSPINLAIAFNRTIFLVYFFTLAMAIQMSRTSFTLSRASLIDKIFFLNIELIDNDLLKVYFSCCPLLTLKLEIKISGKINHSLIEIKDKII